MGLIFVFQLSRSAVYFFIIIIIYVIFFDFELTDLEILHEQQHAIAKPCLLVFPLMHYPNRNYLECTTLTVIFIQQNAVQWCRTGHGKYNMYNLPRNG